MAFLAAAIMTLAGSVTSLRAVDAPAVPEASITPPTATAPVAPLPDHVPLDLFSLPDDLEIKVWAKAPLLQNPTNMDIDADGRIWIAQGVNYRSHQARHPEGDKIVVLEDTDGDGVADKTSVFVQEPFLAAPLGIAVIDNKVIVSMSPDLIVYTDVNRDRRFDPAVDKREVFLSGFKGRNHDHSLHSVTFGPDGRWYFNVGNQGAFITDRSGKTFRIGNVAGDDSGETNKARDLAGQKSDDGHVYPGGTAWRIRPDGTNAEVIGYGLRNSYEQVVTSFGDVFQNDNDDPPAARTSFLMEYANMGFFSRDGQRTWQADRRPGQTTAQAEWRMDDPGSAPKGDVYGGGAPTGIVFYESDVLGKKWRGALLSADAGRNTILGYFPKLDGAGYPLTNFEFLTSNKAKEFAGSDFVRGRPAGNDLKTFFRPSDITVGPDGALYIADWFDSRVGGHGDNDVGLSGTIYRVAPKGFKSVIPKFDRDTVEGQITALKSPATNVRAIGYQGLVARGASAEAPVAALLNDENPYIRARAVWLLTELGAGGIARVEALLRSPDPMMRIVAYRALRRADRPVLDFAKTLASDSDPAVRREVALSLRDVPIEKSRDLLVKLAAGYDGTDRAYLEAWGIGCTDKEAEVYAALEKNRPDTTPDRWPPSYAGLIWRLTPPDAAKDLATRAASTRLDSTDRLAAVTALGFIPTATAANAMIDLAQSENGQVKAHALWWLLNYKDSRWKDHGLDAALKTRGIYDPEKVSIAGSVVPVPPPTQLPAAAEIAKLTGDAARGAAKIGACYLCHRIGNQGNEYGPTLTGFANRQSTEATVLAIINPSAEISLGFEGTEVTLQDGTVVHGRVLSNGDPLIVQSMGGVTQLIPASRLGQPAGLAAPGAPGGPGGPPVAAGNPGAVAGTAGPAGAGARGGGGGGGPGRGGRGGRPLGRSLMLGAEQLGLSAQDVADIVAYLKTQ